MDTVTKIDSLIRTSIPDFEASTIGGWRTDRGKLTLTANEHSRASKTAWWLWRLLVDALFPPDDRFVKYQSDSEDNSFYSSPWWTDWRAGPGVLAWSTGKNYEWENDALISWVNTHWGPRQLKDFYYLLLGFSALVLNRDDFPKVTSSTQLYFNVQQLAKLPLGYLTSTGGQTKLTFVTTLADDAKFERWVAEDPPGQMGKFIETPELQTTLFELLGVAQSARDDSHRECTQYCRHRLFRSSAL